MHVLPQTLSSRSANPLDFTVLCSSIPESTPIVNEDQAIDRVGVAHPSFNVIHEKYEWKPEQQPMAKDDSLPSTPPPLFPDIFNYSSIADFSHVSPCTDAPIVDHSQNTLDVGPSFDSGEEKSFIQHPHDSSFAFSRNAEGEHYCFSSTPLCDSSNHEDVEKHPEFSDLGCHDLSTFSSNEDVDLIIVNMSKILVYDDLFVDKVKTPQTIEELQLEFMVMLGPCCHEVSFTSDQEIVEISKAPHHLSILTEDQPNTQISLPPLKLHDPITHALEEYYTTSILAQHKWSTFLTFSCMAQSRE